MVYEMILRMIHGMGIGMGTKMKRYDANTMIWSCCSYGWMNGWQDRKICVVFIYSKSRSRSRRLVTFGRFVQ